MAIVSPTPAPVQTCTVEVWVVTDENGDSAVGIDQAAALAKYDEDVGRDDEDAAGHEVVQGDANGAAADRGRTGRYGASRW